MAIEGTLELLGRNLAFALEPLKNRLTAGNLTGLAEELGLALPPAIASAQGVNTGAASIVGAIDSLPSAIVDLEAAIAADDTGQIVDAGVSLLRAVLDAFLGFGDLASAIHSAASGLGAADRAKLEAFADALPRRLFDFVLMEYIRHASPGTLEVLTLVGLADDEIAEAAAGDALARPQRVRGIHFDRLLTLLTAPENYLRDRLGWGAAGFDGRELFTRIQALFTNHGTPVLLLEPPGQPPILEAFLVRMQADGGSPPGLTVKLRTPAIEDFTKTYPISSVVSLVMSTTARFDGGLDITVRPPLNITAAPIAGSANIGVTAGVAIGRDEGPMVLLGEAGGNGLFLQKFSGHFGISGNWSPGSSLKVEPTVAADIEGGQLVLDFSQADGFLKTISGGVRIDASFESGLRWAPSTGISFEGSSAIEIALPLHLSLGPLDVQTLYLIAGIGSDGSLPLELSCGFSVSLGPLKAAIDRFGVKAVFTFPADGSGNLGRANLAFQLKPPNGVGLSIDAGVVRGGGYLDIDTERGEYAGMLELSILDTVSVTAIGVISTKLPNLSGGFAFVAIISVEFNPGMQLGFGFTLIGVGGLVGINRGADLAALAQGARSGSIDSVLFPHDVIANAPRIISDLKAFFPPEDDTFLIGPMAKFGWGTPTLISLSLGIIVEIPGNIAIVGKLTVAIPDERLPLIIINVAFMGAIEFDKKRGWFFATLYDSRVIYMTLDGGMGVLAAFGNDSNFVVTVGGFHPSYNPPTLPFPPISRLAINILNTPVARIRVEAYFAVTSNTVQFGASAELYFGIRIASVEGHLAFDALFQFSPFYFIISISASLSVKLFGMGLFSVRFRGSLEGTSPWHVEGTGSISILFWDIDVDFSHTWGDKEDTRLPPISVMPILAAELAKVENWTAELANSNSLLVTLRTIDPATELVLHPVGSLRITQRAVPLGLRLDKFGSQRPDDANRFTVDASSPGIEKRATVKESFAMAQFKDFSDSEKLSASDYEKEDAGLELSVTGTQTNTSYATKRVVRYEQIIIDTALRRVTLFLVELIGGLFTHFLGGNAATKATISAKIRDQKHLFDEKVTAGATGYVVVSLADNSPIAGAPQRFASRASAQEYMADQVKENPGFANEAHIVRPHEMRQAA